MNKFNIKILKKEYEDGKTCHDLAKKYKSHPTTISKFLIRHGIKLRKSGPPRGKHTFNLVGQTFDKILVLSLTDERSNDRRPIWKCKCIKCNFKKKLDTKRVKSGKMFNCYCLKTRHKHKGYGDITLTQWNSIKNCANTRNIPFEITIEQAWNLFLKQNGKCSLTGLNITFAVTYNKRTEYTTASLDRIDSAKPYTIDNVQWIHKDLQYMKWNYDEKYYIEMCKLVSNGPKKEYYNELN